MCVLIFSTTLVRNISHSKKKWARYDQKRFLVFHVKYTSFLSDFKETRILSKDFLKVLKYQIPWKSVQWEPIFSMWTDGRTDMTKLIVAFRNLANAPPKNQTGNDAYGKCCLHVFRDS